MPIINPLNYASADDESRNIPAAVKRAVRKRCRFGCVVCAAPLFQYDHMEEWSVVRRHDQENITLLCPNHHADKTNGVLPLFLVKKYDKDVALSQRLISEPRRLFFNTLTPAVTMGSNTFTAGFEPREENVSYYFPLVIDYVETIWFKIENGELLLSAKIYDQGNDLLLHIDDNELRYSLHTWDVEYVGTKITLRRNLGEILLSVDINPDGNIFIYNADIALNGVRLLITPSSIKIGSGTVLNTITRTIANGYAISLALECALPAAIGSYHIERSAYPVGKKLLPTDLFRDVKNIIEGNGIVK